jgi:hypothetical protein
LPSSFPTSFPLFIRSCRSQVNILIDAKL